MEPRKRDGMQALERGMGCGLRNQFKPISAFRIPQLLYPAVEKVLDDLAARWMAQFPQGFRLNLADSLARYREDLAHFFERSFAAIADPESQLDHHLFARRKRFQDVFDFLLQARVDHCIRRRNGLLIFNEIAKM